MKQILFSPPATRPAATVHRFTASSHTFSGLEQLTDIRQLPQYFSGSEVVDTRKVRLYFSPDFKQLSGAQRGRYRWYFEKCGFSGASEGMKGGRGFYQYKADSESDARQIAQFHNDLLDLARRPELSANDTVTTDPQYAATGQKITQGLVAFLRPYSAAQAQAVRDELSKQSAHDTQMQEEATNRAALAEQEERSKATTATSKISRYAALAILAAALVGAVLFAALRKKHR